jgi:hypothetical protein
MSIIMPIAIRRYGNIVEYLDTITIEKEHTKIVPKVIHDDCKATYDRYEITYDRYEITYDHYEATITITITIDEPPKKTRCRWFFF